MSLRDVIAEADDLDATVVEVPEWGDVKLQLRQFSVETRAAYMEQMAKLYVNGEPVEGALAQFNPTLLIAACYDPDTGEPVFQPSDAAMLRTKSGAVVDRIAGQVMDLNGMREDSVDLGKDGSSTEPSDANDGSGSG